MECTAAFVFVACQTLRKHAHIYVVVLWYIQTHGTPRRSDWVMRTSLVCTCACELVCVRGLERVCFYFSPIKSPSFCKQDPSFSEKWERFAFAHAKTGYTDGFLGKSAASIFVSNCFSGKRRGRKIHFPENNRGNEKIKKKKKLVKPFEIDVDQPGGEGLVNRHNLKSFLTLFGTIDKK